MVKLASVPITKQLMEVLTECGHTRRVLLGNKSEFRIQKDVRANVPAPGNRVENSSKNLQMIRSSCDRFNSGVRLSRIGGVCDNDPVAMPQ